MSKKKRYRATFATSPADVRKNLPAVGSALVAHARNDITIPYYSGALQHADDTLIQRGGGRGLKIYDEIERDPYAYAVLQKRKKHLLARVWMAEPASAAAVDVAVADFVRGVFAALPFDRICEDLLDATLKGFAVSEIVWRRDGARIVPDRIVSHDQRRFTFGEDWRPRLLTWTNIRDGEGLPDRKFIVHRYGVKGNNPYGLGLGYRLFWCTLFKREGVAFWLKFLEKFAGPTVVGKTPFGPNTPEGRQVLDSLMSVQTSAAVTLPIGTDVTFLEAARTGAVSYQDWCATWNKEIAVCVTGETLTTEAGDKGSYGLGMVHADMLSMLVDADADDLSDTLRDTLIRWLVDYNFPGAGLPSVWRVRPENERAAAETDSARAVAADATNSALVAVLGTAAHMADDVAARAYLISTGLTAKLTDDTIDRLVEARHAISAGARLAPGAMQNPAFAALFASAGKKKVRFAADPADPTDRITDQLEALTAPHFARRVAAVHRALADAVDLPAAQRALLDLAARWTPDALARPLGGALETASWAGREAVFLDAEGPAFAGRVTVEQQSFSEQSAFFRQKRAQPTDAWTDVLRGVHDRAFVVAGATDMAMLGEFQSAIADAIDNGGTLEEFRSDFDRIVTKYGWTHNGEPGWRSRVIFETNVRTSYMAGRLKQALNPDVVRLRPWWRYRHAETRVPLHPRELHVSWDGRIYRYDHPWWKTHTPPNDWLCSCGFDTLSDTDLRRLGLTPSAEPDDGVDTVRDPTTGDLAQVPAGIGYGWDYQPGALWEQGLVPSALMEDDEPALDNPRHAVEIDTPEPIADLVARAKPFVAKPLPAGLPAEDYVRAFLQPFGADIGRAVLWEDMTGTRIPISDGLFRERTGGWKIGKRDRALLTPLMAETLMDPDEIWMGVARKRHQIEGAPEELILDRRYIRTDGETGILSVFEIGQRWWIPITTYAPADRKGRPDLRLLDRRRGGKLVWSRAWKK